MRRKRDKRAKSIYTAAVGEIVRGKRGMRGNYSGLRSGLRWRVHTAIDADCLQFPADEISGGQSLVCYLKRAPGQLPLYGWRRYTLAGANTCPCQY